MESLECQTEAAGIHGRFLRWGDSTYCTDASADWNGVMKVGDHCPGLRLSGHLKGRGSEGEVKRVVVGMERTKLR